MLVYHSIIPPRLSTPTALSDLQVAIGLPRLATLLEENLLQTIEVFIVVRYLWHNVPVLNSGSNTLQAASAMILHIHNSSA